jgi:uncharacterized protein (TIGR02147 family)
VYDYLDYRGFLRDALAYEKTQGRISGHRDVATFLGLKSPGHITWILQGKRNLVDEPRRRMAKLLGLTGNALEYFLLLVIHNDTSNPDERRRIFARIAFLQSGRKVTPSRAAARYWTRWYNPVLRELVALHKVRRQDAALVAARLDPPLTTEQVEESLDLLLELGMVSAREDGTLDRCESILSAGENWSVEGIRAFQKSLIELSLRSLSAIPRERRDISTLTFSASHERFQKIRQRIQETRAEILTLIRTDPHPDGIYHLVVELFPALAVEKP